LTQVDIHQGDALTVLRTLEPASAHCCVTSPPYWALRDYGTGRWEGGEASCDHVRNHGVQGRNGQRADRSFTGQSVYGETCGKCGASRIDQQMGLEDTPAEYVDKMVAVFAEVRRVLRHDGTLWLNIGDSYANDGKLGGETGGKQSYLGDADRKRVGREKRRTGLKPKDLVGIPWMLAFALRSDGWYLRQDIIWHKPNAMPESVKDRCTKAHEYIFLLSKSERYYYDAEAVAEPASGVSGGASFGPQKKIVVPSGWGVGKEPRTSVELLMQGERRPPTYQSRTYERPVYEKRNRRSVWTVPTRSYKKAHFATFPPKLIEPCILAGCPKGGTVLDPFIGSGTTATVAQRLGRNCVGLELNPEYIDLANERLRGNQLELIA